MRWHTGSSVAAARGLTRLAGYMDANGRILKLPHEAGRDRVRIPVSSAI
jgi:hypothetical protein